MKKRLDQWVVDLGLAPSKTKAQELIEAGAVEILVAEKWAVETRAGTKVELRNDTIRVSEAGILKYVSRGGLKLEGALKQSGVHVKGRRCLDVGISTGGFADCLLQLDASQVVGVDVATDELASGLRSHPRLRMLAGVNAREISKNPELKGQRFDLVVADVSFISLGKIIPEIAKLLSEGPSSDKTDLLLLVKPQFEVGKSNLDKRGVVKSPALYQDVEKEIRAQLQAAGIHVKDYFPSEVKGRDGNQEFFVYGEYQKV